MAAIVRGQYEEEEDQRREQVDENDEGPKHGERRVRSLRVELGKRVSQAVQEEEERDCRQQEGYGQENWEGENSRVKAFLPERFFLGLHMELNAFLWARLLGDQIAQSAEGCVGFAAFGFDKL